MSRVCCEEFSIFCGIRCNLVMYNALLSRWLLDSMNRRDAITPDGYSMARVLRNYDLDENKREQNHFNSWEQSRVARRDTRHATGIYGIMHAYIHTTCNVVPTWVPYVCAYDTV